MTIVGQTDNIFDLSMKPSVIHKYIKATDIDKGTILTGFISEIHKGNFKIESGIENLDVIVKKESAKKDYTIGEYIQYCIKKLNKSSSGSIIAFADDTTGDEQQLVKNPIMPGNSIEVKITECFSKFNGLGLAFNDTKKVIVKENDKLKINLTKGENYICDIVSLDVKKNEVFVIPKSEKLNTKIEEFRTKVGEIVALIVDKITAKGLICTLADQTNVKCLVSNYDNPFGSVKLGQTFQGRIFDYITFFKMFQATLRYEYLQPTINLLLSIDDVAVGKKFLGTITKEFEKFFVVQFFNSISGTITKNKSKRELYCGMISEFEISGLKLGEISNIPNKIFLKIVNSETDSTIFNEYRGIIIKHDEMGSMVQILGKDALNRINNGFNGGLSFMKEGDDFKCVNLGCDIFSVRDLDYYREKSVKSFEDIEESDILRGFVKCHAPNDELEVYVPIENAKTFYKFEYSRVNSENKRVQLSQNQILHLKVAEKCTDGLKLCSKLTSVWSNFDDTVAYVKDYLQLYQLKTENMSIYCDKYDGKVFSINPMENSKFSVELRQKNSIAHIILEKAPDMGDVISGYIIWINDNGSLQLTQRKIKSHEDRLTQLDSITGSIILKTDKFVLAVAVKKKYLLIIPKYLCYNDHSDDIISHIKNDDEDFIIIGFYENIIIVVPESYYNSKSSKPLKRKLSKPIDNIQEEKPVKKSKSTPILLNELIEDEPEVNLNVPSLSNFWSSTLTSINESSVNNSLLDNDDESSDIEMEKKRKKKLTPAEKREQFKKEEARIREIEESLAKSIDAPESVDHFDRLVLANPNDSMIWIKYMAYHLQSAEIEKARNVGRMALKKISFRDEEEKLNVWIALLNLEIRYGTPESFNEIFDEALRVNDPYQVHAKCLDIYVGASMNDDAHNLIAKMIKKFKANMQMWIKIASTYFEINEADKAKKLLSRSLSSLADKERK